MRKEGSRFKKAPFRTRRKRIPANAVFPASMRFHDFFRDRKCIRSGEKRLRKRCHSARRDPDCPCTEKLSFYLLREFDRFCLISNRHTDKKV
jgi:hypothetical protein